VALVTGGTRGIGAAISRSLGQAGAIVAAGYTRDDEAAARFIKDIDVSDDRQGTVHRGNVGNPEDCERVVQEVIEKHGRLDILINNAGINRDAMAAKMTEEQWDAVLDVNLKGTFLCAQAALPGMRERAWGRVVNTSSIGSLGNIGQANYAASKAGVIGLTKTLALEYAKYGVTVNAVAPGPVMTSMLKGVPDAIRDKIVAQVPVGRIAAPEEIANVHVFLCSDEASFITGQVIFADGGMSVGI
jgi:3-oxoacyl-[acyl-carrier protein] reductase